MLAQMTYLHIGNKQPFLDEESEVEASELVCTW
jgi:hypothetical protein